MRIHVTVHAGARLKKVEKLGENSYKVHTPTAPEKGKANESVIAQLAEYLGVRKSAIALERGATSKRKTFVVEE